MTVAAALANPASASADPARPIDGDDAPLSALAPQIEENLRRHVLDLWYPRALDPAGGFRQEYGEDWKRGSDPVRSLVYQSRLTWAAARAARHFAGRAEEFHRAARHGVAFLNGTLRDRERGGFYWQVGAASGKPDTDRGAEKHAYGLAFAIYAASAAHATTGDADALELAQSTFRWLDRCAHDGASGGYFEALEPDGKPILTSPYGAAKHPNDPIGTRYGFKSMNTHIHLLEAFAELAKVWPDAALKARLGEVFRIVRDRIAVPPGCLNLYFNPDWRSVPDHDSFGHDVETAYLLAEAAEVLGIPDDRATWKVARALVDHALDFGWDAAHGGFYDRGSAFNRPTGLEKVWWTQAEGLNALLLMDERYGAETPRYRDAFRRQWEFIRRFQTDARHGGWRSAVEPDGSPMPGRAKSDAWTDPYHQGRALMNVLAALRGVTG